MKFTFTSLLVLSVIAVVSSATYADKVVILRCSSVDERITCTQNLNKISGNVGSSDRIVKADTKQYDGSRILAEYEGNCDKVDSILNTAAGCTSPHCTKENCLTRTEYFYSSKVAVLGIF